MWGSTEEESAESKNALMILQCPGDGPADQDANLNTSMEEGQPVGGYLEPFEIYPSERKNSSSDLHSRLKTRKVLGVGEIRDDGDIYRSKISQILGHSEHLYVKLPKGLFYWQATNVAYFFSSGLLCLLLPQVAAPIELLYYSTESVSSDMLRWLYLPVRFYGSALIGVSVLYRGLMVTRERAHIGSGLLGCSLLFGLQVLISLPWVWSYRHQLRGIQALVFISKIVFGVFGNYIYFEITSSPSTGLIRLLRRLGFSCGIPEYIGGGRTPAASASSYNVASAVSSTDRDPSDTQQLVNQYEEGGRSDQMAEKEKNM